MSLVFNDLLEKAGIPPDQANVMLHAPSEPSLRRVLPALVQTRRKAVETYQASHNAPATRALKKGRPYVASFVRTDSAKAAGASKMMFMGIYENCGWTDRRMEEIWADPEVQFLRETFGIAYGEDLDLADGRWAWFDLRLSDKLSDIQGRLLISARLTQNYVRLAENLEAPVLGILEQGMFDAPLPNWRELVLNAATLRALSPGWAARLAEWRGVYLIVDEADGERYVGSAYGKENLLGRWRAHVAGERGVTAKLRERNPARFRFSILERVSPDELPEDVIGREMTWIERLDTRRYGLNS